MNRTIMRPLAAGEVQHQLGSGFRGRGSTSYIGLYGEAPPEGGTFFRLQVYKRVDKKVGISQVEVYKRVGKSVI